MNLKDIIKPENCCLLKSTTKTEVILELIDLIKEEPEISDIDNLKKEIFFREQLMSTGIGHGIAIPHVRFEGVTHPKILIGIQTEGIQDYGTMDEKPVYFVFLFIVGKEQHKEYLRLLSLVSSKIKDEIFRKKLLSVIKEDDIAALFTGSEVQ